MKTLSLHVHLWTIYAGVWRVFDIVGSRLHSMGLSISLDMTREPVLVVGGLQSCRTVEVYYV